MFTIEIENNTVRFIKPNNMGNLSYRLNLSDLGNVYIENYTGKNGNKAVFLFINRKLKRQHAINLPYDKGVMSYIYDKLQPYFSIVIDDENLYLVRRD